MNDQHHREHQRQRLVIDESYSTDTDNGLWLCSSRLPRRQGLQSIELADHIGGDSKKAGLGGRFVRKVTMATAATGRLNDSSSARGIGCSVGELGGRFVFASSQHAPSFFSEDIAKRYEVKEHRSSAAMVEESSDKRNTKSASSSSGNGNCTHVAPVSTKQFATLPAINCSTSPQRHEHPKPPPFLPPMRNVAVSMVVATGRKNDSESSRSDARCGSPTSIGDIYDYGKGSGTKFHVAHNMHKLGSFDELNNHSFQAADQENEAIVGEDKVALPAGDNYPIIPPFLPPMRNAAVSVAVATGRKNYSDTSPNNARCESPTTIGDIDYGKGSGAKAHVAHNMPKLGRFDQRNYHSFQAEGQEKVTIVSEKRMAHPVGDSSPMNNDNRDPCRLGADCASVASMDSDHFSADGDEDDEDCNSVASDKDYYKDLCARLTFALEARKTAHRECRQEKRRIKREYNQLRRRLRDLADSSFSTGAELR